MVADSPAAGNADARTIAMAEIGPPHGVKGWVRLKSYAEPPQAIEHYKEFATAGEHIRVRQYSGSGRHLIALLEGVETRDEAEQLRGVQLQVPMEQLSPLPEGEYYWHQLIGLEVLRLGGECLGRVESLMETGANDVLVAAQDGVQTLIPWGAPVCKVEMDKGRILVDWDPEY